MPASRQSYPLFIAGAASWFTAWGMQSVLLSWLVVGELGADAAVLGLVQSVAMLPSLLLLLPGGVLADRHDRRRLLWISHTGAGLVVAALAVVVALGKLSLAAVFVFAACMGVAVAFVLPSRDALLNDVSGGDLMRAVTGLTLTQWSGHALGAAAGGLARWMGTANALALQSAVLLLGVLPLLRLPGSGNDGRERDDSASASDDGSGTSALAEIREGLREVYHSPTLLSVLALTTSVGVFFIGPYIVAFPLLVRDYYGGDVAQLALLTMCFPLGTIAGSLLLLARGGIRRKGLALVCALATGTVFLALISLGLPFELMLVVVAAWGLGAAVNINCSRTIFQQGAPRTHRARVLSVYSMGFMGSTPLGTLLCGLLAERWGPLAACGILSASMAVAIAVVVTFTPILRIR
ncbi:MAG: MFS transporter [Deltaproteobacteria bacterium]|nr:MFS transporter [Deltaproteobacteria bacterium]